MSQDTLNIFSTKINSRLIYATREVFWRRMGLKPDLFNDEKAFLEAKGPKLNYSDVDLNDGIPQLKPALLLFEKRIQQQDLEAELHDEALVLFPLKNHPIGFDPLAASFYHLSRYEEYLPHREDQHGRFDEEEALLVKQKCHDRPQVEIYARKVADWLRSYYPDLEIDEGAFTHEVTVDVDQLFALKQKGLARSIAGMFVDLFKGRLGKRMDVLLGRAVDPNDIYQELINHCDSNDLKPLLFFQVGEGSRFDHNNPPHLSGVKDKINALALQAKVGIHPSYYASDEPDKLQKEIERLRSIIASPVTLSRQHYLRFKLPETFRYLQEYGIQYDYSMGYAHRNGFRAGTCKPFRAFDLEREDILDLTFVPNTFMDLAAVRSHVRAEEAIASGKKLRSVVKSFGGHFVTIWHPEVLTGMHSDFNSMQVFHELAAHD